MTDPVRKSAADADDDAVSSEGANPPVDSETGSRSGSTADIGSSFPEAATETIAALLHLVKLMGGELVLNVARGETERFERAVRTKIEQYTSPTTNPAARKAGLAFASHLVEQVLTQLHAQAEVKRSLGRSQGAQRQETRTDNAGVVPSPSKFLN